MSRKPLRSIVHSIICMVALCSVGCSPDRIPSNIIDKEEFAKILFDVHIAESISAEEQSNTQIVASQVLYSHQWILDKHGVTREQVDTTISWYSSRPKIYLDVYDIVIAKLSEQEAYLDSELSKPKTSEKSSAARTDLWKGKQSYQLPSNDSIDSSLPFQFKVDSIFKGQMTLSANYRFDKVDLNTKKELCLIACYADGTRDTTVLEIKQSLTSTKLVLTYKLKDSANVSSVEGFLLKHAISDKPHVVIDEISLQYSPSLD